ncbi:MAG: leucine--tRNA ligase [Phycisphaerae bacterium]
MSASYPFAEIEPKWQQVWADARVFAGANPGQPGSDKPKYYVLDFFPYPSGAGLHVGHPLGYIASDIIARQRRMLGYNVLHPMGWDAFGLPAEQYAIETGIHPAITTQKNVDTFKRQLRKLGLSYDWDREVATCKPDYYKWTQWIFLQIFNSWYDPEYRWTDRIGRKVVGAARPIADLPIPPHVKESGPAAIDEFKNEHRLAFLAEVPVNWCPALGTVLANEEVTNDGRSERGNYPVYRRPLKQWMLRITEYADRLLADLEDLDWPEPIKIMQRNWIGRSQGAYIDFQLASEQSDDVIRVFTTRPDTLFGATYMVLAPEHRLVSVITTPAHREEVSAYVAQARNKSEIERTAEAKTKTGVFTGAFAVNPVNRRKIPIWVADYVLVGYGTGSIMAVPGHDKRDLEFAETFNLPVLQVVQPPDGESDWRGFVGEGTAVNSPATGDEIPAGCDLNGLPTPEAKSKIIAWLEERDLGEGTVQYKLRDWLFSRQRYWGEPFPILYKDDGQIRGVPEAMLPVTLPEMEDFRPTASDDPNAEPQTPLSRAADWTQLEIDGDVYRRELNTMPQWAGSCWYYLRFCDPRNESAFADSDAENYWMSGVNAEGKPAIGGVDLYIGGAEHAVLHLLYARFWHKLLYDLGHVSTPEPFQRLFNQGMIQSYTYRDARGVSLPHNLVEFRDDKPVHKETGEPLVETVEKMSKTLKNVVNPDEIVDEYGADTLRLYEMYMGPLEKSKPWNTDDIIGVHRFLQRVWKLVLVPEDPRAEDGTRWHLNPRITNETPADLEKLLHKTIKKVTEDFARFAFNTAIAQLIVWSNEAQKAPAVGKTQLERFLRLLSPMAPHIAEELWHRLGNTTALAHESWPTFDEALTRDEEVEIAVQINGKIKARIHVPMDGDHAEIETRALSSPEVVPHVSGKTPKKVIVVPNRLINIIL